MRFRWVPGGLKPSINGPGESSSPGGVDSAASPEVPPNYGLKQTRISLRSTRAA